MTDEKSTTEKEIKEEPEIKEESEPKEEDKVEGEEKKKYIFNCTKCGNCCANRGPIPLVMDDLIMWAKNNVVANMMPYLQFIKTPYGTIDLVMSRTNKNPYEFLQKKENEEEEEEPKDNSCPMYNKETKECLIYDNRPLSCQTYPLEFDGQKYMVVDTEDCEGIGNGETTNEERKEMRDLAKSMNIKLTEMRIAMPILAQAFQPFVLNEIMDAQRRYMEAMEKMSPEEREKVEQQMKDRMEQDQSGSKVDVDNPTEDADATK
ncbi:MAG: YkgJ family cysteine cluster protein [Promethearchaeota archaeon]